MAGGNLDSKKCKILDKLAKTVVDDFRSWDSDKRPLGPFASSRERNGYLPYFLGQLDQRFESAGMHGIQAREGDSSDGYHVDIDYYLDKVKD